MVVTDVQTHNRCRIKLIQSFFLEILLVTEKIPTDSSLYFEIDKPLQGVKKVQNLVFLNDSYQCILWHGIIMRFVVLSWCVGKKVSINTLFGLIIFAVETGTSRTNYEKSRNNGEEF